MKNEPVVIVVDDDEGVRDSLKALLESAELSVMTFESGEDFLNEFERDRIACLLLDIRMPDLSGLELQQILKSEGIDMPVIVMTGYADVPIAVKAMKAGAVDFVEKPIEYAPFMESVHHALELAQRPEQARLANENLTARIKLLTPREREVLEQLVIGQPNKVIAHELGISPRTVEIHRAHVMEKMQARGLSQLVRMALASGINPDIHGDEF